MEASLEVARRFGQNLHSVRKETGLSQEQLGFRAGLHRTEVGLLERGARVPRIDTLIKLVGALEIEIDCQLLEGIIWNPGSAPTCTGMFTLAQRTD